MGRTHDKTLVQLAGPAHLVGKPNGILAAALMTQMELDYAQRVAKSGNPSIRCILTTDAESAFQSTRLQERVAPFFAQIQRITTCVLTRGSGEEVPIHVADVIRMRELSIRPAKS